MTGSMNVIRPCRGAWRQRRRGDQGVVTAETALASLTLVALVALILALIGVGLVQVQVVDAAAQIARHAARGDTAAVEKLTAEVASVATVDVTRRAPMVDVRVAGDVRPIRGLAFTIHVEGTATAVLEPGVS